MSIGTFRWFMLSCRGLDATPFPSDVPHASDQPMLAAGKRRI